MKKPHLTPISSNFNRSQNITIEYTDKNHFIQFDCNSISFKPLIAWAEPAPGNIDLILQKFLAILRTYNEKHFHKLKLNFYEWNELDTITLRKLGSEIGKHFRNLHELSFHFFSCSRITESGLQHLINPISRHLKGLEALSLSVTGSTPVNDKGANYMRNLVLKRVKKLSKFRLVFSGESIDMGEERHHFEADVLTRLAKQRSVLADSTVGYLQTIVTSNAALKLYESMNYCLKSVEQLVLRHSDILTLDMISLALRRVRKLQVLYLSFLDSYLDGDHNKIKEINSYMIKNLSNLRYLTLSFLESDQIRKENMITMLSDTLPHLSKLRGFTLSVHNAEEITDEDLLLIIDQICLQGKQLGSLTLDFEALRKITGPALEQATQTLTRNLINLRELTLNFRYTEKRWNELPVLVLSFSSLVQLHLYLPTNNFRINLSGCHEHLEGLTLSFGECIDLSGSKLEQLITPLFKLEFKKLRQFNLLLAQASKIQDDDIRMLCSCNWICMPNLKEFTFGISYAETITDCALSYISDLIKTQLKRLSTLKLSFRSSDSFTENALNKLCRTIVENIIHLNDLELDFPAVRISSKVIDLIVTEIVNYAKQLKKIRMFLFNGNHNHDIIHKMRRKLSFIPLVDFYCY